jgi:hypothetical protein
MDHSRDVTKETMPGMIIHEIEAAGGTPDQGLAERIEVLEYRKDIAYPAYTGSSDPNVMVVNMNGKILSAKQRAVLIAQDILGRTRFRDRIDETIAYAIARITRRLNHDAQVVILGAHAAHIYASDTRMGRAQINVQIMHLDERLMPAKFDLRFLVDVEPGSKEFVQHWWPSLKDLAQRAAIVGALPDGSSLLKVDAMTAHALRQLPPDKMRQIIDRTWLNRASWWEYHLPNDEIIDLFSSPPLSEAPRYTRFINGVLTSHINVGPYIWTRANRMTIKKRGLRKSSASAKPGTPLYKLVKHPMINGYITIKSLVRTSAGSLRIELEPDPVLLTDLIPDWEPPVPKPK